MRRLCTPRVGRTLSCLAALASLTSFGSLVSCSTETPLPMPSGGTGGSLVHAGTGAVSAGGGGSGGFESLASGGQPMSSGGVPATGGGSGGSVPETGGTDAGTGGGTGGGPDDFDGMELFILFGQSNMAGSSPIEQQDRLEDPRIKVLGLYDCEATTRIYNEWDVASPPLHLCGGELGPADSFAKALAAAWPNSEIGLIPNAVPGVEIDFFRKGMISNENESYKELPADWNSAYDMMVARTQLAMESGRVRGILFHQGESDNGQSAWVGKVAEIVEDLRADLGLGEEVPFLPGELPPTGCCGGHNTYVNQLASVIPNTVVVSAAGLAVHDSYHFDTVSVRTFGQRYADAFLELVPTP